MLRVRDGQVETLAELYRRHRLRLFNFFLHLTGNPHRSEDLVQEVFLRMLKYRHTFKEGSRFSTWMHQVARNAHYDAWRKTRRESSAEPDDLNDKEVLWGTGTRPDWEAGKEQELMLVQEALASLPVDLREVLVLSRFQELKYEQIAEVLNCTAGAVKMRVFRGLQELRKNFVKLAGKEQV